jgi:formamidopyrimidine-DNA glycosylase
VPELVEVEAYRALAERRALRRRIEAVDAPDAWFLKRGLTAAAVEAALVGRTFTSARRIGKLLLLDTSRRGPVLGLRFGMTGRLLVDGRTAIDRLIYSSGRDDQAWDRLVVRFRGDGELRVRDARRLGGVELDPDEDALGPDARAISFAELRAALAGSEVAVKARLMDQRRVAGIGNLIVDELLWRAALAPTRPAASLDAREVRGLHRHVHRTVELLIARGGSHTGDLQPMRTPGGICPRDGRPLARATVGGRTTWWCPHHQRT